MEQRGRAPGGIFVVKSAKFKLMERCQNPTAAIRALLNLGHGDNGTLNHAQ
jgi:hypothetical protein